MSEIQPMEEKRQQPTTISTVTEAAAAAATGREPHQYQRQKMGDILDSMDDLLTRKRQQVTTKASQKVHGMLDELKSLYNDLKGMVNEAPENVDPDALKRKQNHLNDLENKAVQGVYGAEAKICPLDQVDQPVHHVRIQAIPPGQATVRDLIEKCHQMVIRVLDRLEETVATVGSSEQGTSTTTTTTTVQTGGQEQRGHIQTHGTGVTLTKDPEKEKQQQGQHQKHDTTHADAERQRAAAEGALGKSSTH